MALACNVSDRDHPGFVALNSCRHYPRSAGRSTGFGSSPPPPHLFLIPTKSPLLYIHPIIHSFIPMYGCVPPPSMKFPPRQRCLSASPFNFYSSSFAISFSFYCHLGFCSLLGIVFYHYSYQFVSSHGFRARFWWWGLCLIARLHCGIAPSLPKEVVNGRPRPGLIRSTPYLFSRHVLIIP